MWFRTRKFSKFHRFEGLILFVVVVCDFVFWILLLFWEGYGEIRNIETAIVRLFLLLRVIFSFGGFDKETAWGLWLSLVHRLRRISKSFWFLSLSISSSSGDEEWWRFQASSGWRSSPWSDQRFHPQLLPRNFQLLTDRFLWRLHRRAVRSVGGFLDCRQGWRR